MYKLSRYWNKLAYFIVGIGEFLVWDQTGKVINGEGYASGYDVIDQTAKDILTSTDFK